MQTLPEALLAGLFASAGSFKIGLSHLGKPVEVDGYSPVTVPADQWTVEGATAETVVRFGPYVSSFDVDAVTVASAEMFEVQPLPAAIRVYVGIGLMHVVTLDVRTAEQPDSSGG